MKKIVSLFQRNYQGDRLVRNEIVLGAEWVVKGEGTATRKYDGTACMVKDRKLYKRHDAKRGKQPPPDFIPAQDEADEVTGHWPGWIPVTDSPNDQWHREAFLGMEGIKNGTYELCGPKIQGNPEGFETHVFVPHGAHVLGDCPRDYHGLEEYFRTHDIEGVVWWKDLNDPDCDKVKIKARDFGLKRPEHMKSKENGV